MPVSSTDDVIQLMDLGQMNRAVSSTAMNDRSSRSHSCVTVHVQGRDLTSGTIIHGSMHLVDLAGSERVDKSEVTGDRLKEAQHINKSLSALGDVISSLSQKNAHVPYRNSKLTQLLQDSLGKILKILITRCICVLYILARESCTIHILIFIPTSVCMLYQEDQPRRLCLSTLVQKLKLLEKLLAL